jgi:hypothetical protein
MVTASVNKLDFCFESWKFWLLQPFHQFLLFIKTLYLLIGL